MARRNVEPEEVEVVVEDDAEKVEFEDAPPEEDDGGPETQEMPFPTEIAEGALYNVGPVPPELMYLYPDAP